MTNIKDYLHYYINTGAEVAVKYLLYNKEEQRCSVLTEKEYEFLIDIETTSIRFTNLIRVDELTDEQKVKLFSDITSYQKKPVWMGNSFPQLFHELLQLRVDLFNLMK